MSGEAVGPGGENRMPGRSARGMLGDGWPRAAGDEQRARTPAAIAGHRCAGPGGGGREPERATLHSRMPARQRGGANAQDRDTADYPRPGPGKVPILALRDISGAIDYKAARQYTKRVAAAWGDYFILSGATRGQDLPADAYAYSHPMFGCSRTRRCGQPLWDGSSRLIQRSLLAGAADVVATSLCAFDTDLPAKQATSESASEALMVIPSR